MDKSELGALLRGVIPAEPIVAVIVPESDLKALALAARTAVFDIDETRLRRHGERRALLELDRASELFADLLDVDIPGLVGGSELRRSAEHVRAWLDAGCITLPPVGHIRALVEALS